MESADGYTYYDEARQEVLTALDELPATAEVLDVGAGFGNNARELLQRGYSVTATETSPASVTRLEQLRRGHPDRLVVRRESVGDLADTSRFDAVVCTMVLHFLPPEAAQDALRRLQASVRPGGLCIITSYLADAQLSEEYTWLLKPGELRASFKSWEILGYEETYPFTFGRIRTARQLVRWLRGRRGYKAARIIARRPI